MLKINFFFRGFVSVERIQICVIPVWFSLLDTWHQANTTTHTNFYITSCNDMRAHKHYCLILLFNSHRVSYMLLFFPLDAEHGNFESTWVGERNVRLCYAATWLECEWEKRNHKRIKIIINMYAGGREQNSFFSSFRL